MKTRLHIFCGLVFFVLFSFFSANLNAQIISQYIETDSGSTPKGIEIWNNTSAPLNFEENALIILKGANGGALSQDASLNTGTLDPGAVLVIGTSDIGTYLSDQGLTVTYVEKGFNFNGDDALQVTYGGNPTDTFGVPETDPGSAWEGNGVSTRNQNIALISGITSGSSGFTDPSTRFSTVNTSPSATGGLEGFGVAPETASGGNIKPVISNITTSPEAPTSTDAISVSAVVTDTDGSIDDVTLNWGTSSGSLTNMIAMSLVSGDTYATDTDIPAQANGTTVYFEVVATDNEPEVTTTPEQSIQVQDPLPPGALIITEIMQNPAAVGDGAGEYFEIYNRTASPIDIEGYDINDDSSTDHTINNGGSGLIVPAMGFLVLGRNADVSTNGGVTVDYVFPSSVNLSNSNDVLILADLSDNEIDRVEWDDGATFPDPSGAAMVYVGLPDEDNNDGALWIAASFSEGIGTDAGSPGLNGLDQFLDGALIYDGSWSPSAPNASTGSENALVLSGTVDLGDIQVKTLQIRSGATVTVNGLLDVEGSVISNGSLTFTSTASGDGELASLNANAQVYGEVTVQNYFADYRAYRMVSSAVFASETIYESWQESGAEIAGLGTDITGGDASLGFDQTISNNPSMFTVDVPNQEFVTVANTNDSFLNAGDSYLMFIRGDRSIDLTDNDASSTTVLRATGALATGDQTQTYEVTAADQFIMFGNPYQATVDVNEVFANAGSDTDINTNQYYVFDPSLAAGDGTGAYVLVDLTTGTSTGSDANEFLEPGQAAQVQVTAAGMTDVVFEENDKSQETVATTLRSTNADLTTITGQLFTTSNYESAKARHDGFAIVLDDAYSNEVDNQDGDKLYNFSENIAIDNAGEILALERRSSAKDQDKIQLFVNQYNHEAYTLVVTVVNLEGIRAKFEDAYTGISQELNDGENVISYSVSDDASKATDRFSILFEETSLGIDPIKVSNTTIYPNPINDRFTISSPAFNQDKIDVSIVNMMGQDVYSKVHHAESGKVSIITSNLSTGVYLVKVRHDDVESTHRLLKQ